MNLIGKIKKIGLEKIYLLTYVCTFSIILFFRVSQFGMAMTSSSSKHSWFYILYTIATLVGIMINLMLSFIYNNKRKKFIVLTIFLAVCAVLPMFLGFSIMSLPFLLIFLLIINARIAHPMNIMKYDLWMRIIMFFVIVIMYLLNLYPKNTTVAIISRSYDTSIQRYSFGFIHSNSLALFVLTILISFVMVYIKQARKIIGIGSIILVYIITFMLTDSRIFELSGLILIVGLILYESKYVRKIVNIITLPFITISLLAGCIYLYLPYLGHGLESILNTVLSNRLSIGSQAFKYYPLKLTGYSSTPLLDINHVNIDDMYVGYMLRFGIIGFLILQGYFYVCGYMSRKSNNYLGNICLLIITASIVTINTNMLFAPLMYVVSVYYMNRKEQDNEFTD